MKNPFDGIDLAAAADSVREDRAFAEVMRTILKAHGIKYKLRNAGSDIGYDVEDLEWHGVSEAQKTFDFAGTKFYARGPKSVELLSAVREKFARPAAELSVRDIVAGQVEADLEDIEKELQGKWVGSEQYIEPLRHNVRDIDASRSRFVENREAGELATRSLRGKPQRAVAGDAPREEDIIASLHAVKLNRSNTQALADTLKVEEPGVTMRSGVTPRSFEQMVASEREDQQLRARDVALGLVGDQLLRMGKKESIPAIDFKELEYKKSEFIGLLPRIRQRLLELDDEKYESSRSHTVNPELEEKKAFLQKMLERTKIAIKAITLFDREYSYKIAPDEPYQSAAE